MADDNSMYLMAIVAIVAIVALIVMVMNFNSGAKLYRDENAAGKIFDVEIEGVSVGQFQESMVAEPDDNLVGEKKAYPNRKKRYV